MNWPKQVDFYETQQRKLGLEFLYEVYSTIRRITEYPKAFPELSTNTRKCLTTRLPFGVIYQIKEDEVFIVAIAHLARKPGYWKERLSKLWIDFTFIKDGIFER